LPPADRDGTVHQPAADRQDHPHHRRQELPPAQCGAFFNSRHFIFRLGRAASNQSLVGAAFVRRPGALGGVHPYLSTLDGFIFARSLSHGQTAHFAGGTELRHIRLPGVPRGTYILAVEFLDSPLRTVQTPPFDLWLVP